MVLIGEMVRYRESKKGHTHGGRNSGFSVLISKAFHSNKLSIG